MKKIDIKSEFQDSHSISQRNNERNNNQETLTERLVISRKNFIYVMFKLILLIASLVSTPFYLYIAAFGFQIEETDSYPSHVTAAI